MRRDEFGFDPEERVWVERRAKQILDIGRFLNLPPLQPSDRDEGEEDERHEDN